MSGSRLVGEDVGRDATPSAVNFLMDTDRNLLFGVLALQADLLTPAQFAEGCSAWAGRKRTPLAELLVERGWLTASDRVEVEKFLERKLAKHGGNAKAGLAEVTTDQVRQSLASVNDVDVRQSLAGPTPPPHGHVLLATTEHIPQQGERYTLSRLHATGGIGRVWLARDASLGRDVALKELRPERAGQPALWARFLREAQVTGQLEHPGIVPVYEVGRRPDDRSPFYTMRFVRGRTLAEAARAYHERRARGEAGPLELRDLLTAFQGVCHAVAYAHSRGVLHRDLKPQNIVLGDYGEVMVLDWGLAKVLGQPETDPTVDRAPVALEADGPGDATVAGQVLGTPSYMAPEQAEGRLDLLDTRTDVYGLGAVLYEVLAGRPPFDGEDTTAVLRRVAHDSPAPPRVAVSSVPRALEAVCLKALAKRPDDRYAFARELGEEVKRFLADEPVTAYRDPLTTRLTRWGRRHRTFAVAAGILLLCSAVGLAVGAGLINRERARAEANFRQARAAVDEYFTTVSESKLLNVPGLQPLRKELLESARKYYQDFLRERGDDPKVRAEAAAALFRVAQVTTLIANEVEAVPIYQQAIAQYDTLVRDNPENATYLSELAYCHSCLGLLLDGLERDDEAMIEFRRTIEIRSGLAERFPANAHFQLDLARSYRCVGDLYRQVGNFGPAEENWKKARTIQETVLRNPPPRNTALHHLTRRGDAVTVAREDLADVLLDLSGIYRETGNWGQALETGQRARDLLEGMLRDRPEDAELRAQLAAGYTNLALTTLNFGQPKQSLELTTRAMTILDKLVAANSTVSQYRGKLADANLTAGYALERLDGWKEAARHYQRVIELAEQLVAVEPNAVFPRSLLAQGLLYRARLLIRDGRLDQGVPLLRRAQSLQEAIVRDYPRVVFYQFNLAFVCRALGRAEEKTGRRDAALAAFDRARQLDAGQAERLFIARYNEACDLALMARVAPAARHDALVERAFEALRRAVAQGYRSLAEMRSDPDWSELRNRAGFKTVLATLKARSGQGK